MSLIFRTESDRKHEILHWLIQGASVHCFHFQVVFEENWSK